MSSQGLHEVPLSAGPAPLLPYPATGGEIIGSSAAIRRAVERATQVARTTATVLLLGDTGTGKELLASTIHRRSRRHDRPMVTVNCAALPANLVESELFGRERGAFTGAHSTQIGRFELAHRGTIFLDEIGELPFDLQAKLLRFLQDGRMERLGSPHTIELDVRVIAATNRSLADDVREGRFRRDLYYRLNVFPITLPPLRDRREDIADLARHLVTRLSRKLGKPMHDVPAAAVRELERYDWPGNIRELENVLQRAIILSPGTALSLDGAWMPMEDAPADPSAVTMAESERRHIQRVLEATRWRIEGARGAAQQLDLKPSTLRSRMAKLGIVRP
jgi:formate hydrogenlyase transcriptional activator